MPPSLLTYLIYTYVVSVTPVPRMVFGPVELVTVPEAKFTTGASMVRESVTDIPNPAVVVVDDPVDVSDSLDLMFPIVVRY